MSDSEAVSNAVAMPGYCLQDAQRLGSLPAKVIRIRTGEKRPRDEENLERGLQ